MAGPSWTSYGNGCSMRPELRARPLHELWARTNLSGKAQIRFDQATCRACPTRQVCTAAKDAPRQLTVRPQAHHEAMQAARQRQETPEFKEKYALRSGVESSLSQGIR